MQSYAVVNDGDTLLFQVNTCNEESTEVTVVELENAIIVTARTERSFSCGGDDCSDPRPPLRSWWPLVLGPSSWVVAAIVASAASMVNLLES